VAQAQDVTQVQHLIRHVLGEVKRRHPGVRRITIQSDNASFALPAERMLPSSWP
jgi:hypothetical protein